MKDESDESLMAAYAAGSLEAFDELFRRYERSACAFFRRRVACEERARDLYQELFLRLHRARRTYDPSQAFRPWFFRVARNVLIDDTRRAFRSHELALDIESAATGAASDAERVLAAREQASQQLASLTDEAARVLVKAVLLGECHAEIAAELGKSRASVKQTAARALRRLRARWNAA